MRAYWSQLLYAALFAVMSGASVLAQSDDAETVEQLYRMGQYIAAGAMAERLVATASAGAESTRGRAALVGWLALTDYMQGRMQEAEARALQALAELEKTPSSEVPAVHEPPLAELTYILADIYARQNRVSDAGLYYERALNAHDALGGLSPLFLKMALLRLADIEATKRHLARATELYVRALTDGDERAVDRLRAVARQHLTDQRSTDAEVIYKRTLELISFHRARDAVVLRVLHDMADLYLAHGRDQDAEPIFVRIAAMRGTSEDCMHGPDGEQGGLRDTLQKYEEAKIGFRRKEQTGFYAFTPDMKKRLKLTARATTQVITDVAKQLDRLSSPAGDTAALVYDGTKCVYLVSRRGFERAEPIRSLANDPLFATSGVSGAIRAGLELDARVANRQPRKRAGGVDAASFSLPTHRNARAALRIASDLLLPSRIRERIMFMRPTRLLVLAGGDLSTVPFAALLIDAGTLMDVAVPVVLADIDGLFSSGPKGFKPTSGLKIIVGDPELSGDPVWLFKPLPFARQEAVDVARLLGTQAVIGQEAIQSRVVSRIAQGQKTASLIYLATHGIADGDNPMDASFLALKDGHLLARDIKKFKFERGPLVVMSACQTGLGKTFQGGVFGLARAWHFAGASQIVMSLWDIDDAATGLLMTEFVTALTRGATAEDALFSGMRKARDQYPNDPGRWASLTLYGSPTPVSSK